MSNSFFVEALESRRLLSAAMYADLSPGGVDPQHLTPFGNRAVFSGSTVDAGRELWITDGTTGGTRMIADLTPGTEGSDPIPLAAAGKYFYFLVTDAKDVTSLWRTDGKGKDTIALTSLRGEDVNYYDIPNGSVEQTADLNGRLIYAQYDSSQDAYDLWSSDGSPKGTHEIAENVPSGDALPRIVIVDQTAYLSTGTDGGELLRTDGTKAGTSVLFSGNGVNSVKADGSTIYFTGDNGTGEDGLWEYKPTKGGRPRFVQHFYESAVVGNGGGALWLLVKSKAGTSSVQVWDLNNSGFHQCSAFTDDEIDFLSIALLTTKGVVFTTKETDIWFASAATGKSSLLYSLEKDDVTGGMYITALDGTSRALYAELSDGSSIASLYRFESGQTMPTDLGAVSPKQTPTVVNDTLLYAGTDATGQPELFSDDGTSPTEITDLSGGSAASNLDNLGVFENELVFSTDYALPDGTSDLIIWETDGSGAPKRLAQVPYQDYEEQQFNAPQPVMIAATKHLYFAVTNLKVADHTDITNSTELWMSDGTAAGTRRVQTGFWTVHFVGTVGDRAIFTSGQMDENAELWATDGTTAGTKKIGNVLGSQTINGTSVNGRLYFLNGDLWQTDGTAAGTLDVSSKLGTNVTIGEIIATSGELLAAGTVELNENWTPTFWTVSSSGTIKQIAQLGIMYDPGAFEGTRDLLVDPSGGAWFTGTSKSGVNEVAHLAVDGTISKPMLSVQNGGYQLLGELDGSLLVQEPSVSQNPAQILTDGTHTIALKARLGEYTTSATADDSVIFAQEGGLVRVTDSGSAVASGVQDPDELTVLGSRVFFRGDDNTHGTQLWSYVPTRSISGNVFADSNGNGLLDSGEKPLSGYQVYLDHNDNGTLQANEPSVRTDSDGDFEFDDLEPGTYNLRITSVAGSVLTTPAVYVLKIGSESQLLRDFGVTTS